MIPTLMLNKVSCGSGSGPSDFDSKLMLNLASTERKIKIESFSMFKDDEKLPPVGKIIAHRFRTDISMLLAYFFMCSLKRPGDVVMWSYTMYHLAKDIDRVVCFEDFLQFDFPYGYPTRAVYDSVWDTQKTSKGNWLDYGDWDIPKML